VSGRVRAPHATVLVLAVGLGFGLAAVGARAIPRSPGPASPTAGTIDLLGRDVTRIVGSVNSANVGGSVAGIGDFNGDRLPDLAIGAPQQAQPGEPRNAGAVYVVYGSRRAHTLDLKQLGRQGLLLRGAGINDKAGRTVAAAGDVNGDGLADLAVAAPLADRNGRRNSGSVFVVFGRRDRRTVNLNGRSGAGYVIDGAVRRDFTGISLAAAGDVNGDGRADLVIGAYGSSPQGRTSAGIAYVVFGQAGTARIDLAALGPNGFRIDGEAIGDVAGTSVAGAGDVAGDGLADVLVGAPMADPQGRHDAGAAYVVRGKADSADVDLAAPGDAAWRIDGALANDRLTGFLPGGLADAGDVNGDGHRDILVGAQEADPLGRQDAGAAYVVFGGARPAPLDLAALGEHGVRLMGAQPNTRFGRALVALGDRDGDGFGDVAIGAPGDGALDARAEGVYVWHGRAEPGDVDAALLGVRDQWLAGAIDARAGEALAAVGDLDGDGRPELLIGAIGLDPGNRGYLTGGAYLVPSRVPARGLRRHGTSSNEVWEGAGLRDVLRAGLGDDQVFGADGSDVVDGQTGDDRVDGGPGPDIVIGGFGNDVLIGGPGDDTIQARDGAHDAVFCGLGEDRAIVDRGDRVDGCERVSRR
jgi:Ca2+-binding RTX toxin-like protein